MINVRRPSLGASPMARREARWGLLFLSPWILGFLGFTLFPMIATLAFSFTNINLAQEEPQSGLPLRSVGKSPDVFEANTFVQAIRWVI